jgi:apolipoprotein N-acyltransferase
MRALETGRYMLRATNSGVTAIIDEKGVVRSWLPKFTEGLLSGSAQPFTGATPFVHWGNAPALLLCCLMLAVSALPRWRRRERKPPA